MHSFCFAKERKLKTKNIKYINFYFLFLFKRTKIFQNFILLLNKKKRKKFAKKYVLLENLIYDFLNWRIENLDNKNNTKNLQLEKIRIKDLNSSSQFINIKNDRVLSFNEHSNLQTKFVSKSKNFLIKYFQLNPGSFFPQKKIFMQYWIFPLIGFVGLTWNKNSNLFEIIDFNKSFLYFDKTNINNNNNILINKKNEKYNLNQISKFSFPIQQEQYKKKLALHAEQSQSSTFARSARAKALLAQVDDAVASPPSERALFLSRSEEAKKRRSEQKKQESNPNDLYEYYFMAKCELEQKLSKLNNNANQPAKSFIKNYQVYDKNHMLLNSFLWSKTSPIEIGSFFFNNNQNLTNIVPTLTSNIREIYKKSPKKLLPISMYYKKLNNNLQTKFASNLRKHSFYALSFAERRSEEASKRSKKEENYKSKTQKNKIKKNTLFSIIKIPNTFSIKPINKKQLFGKANPRVNKVYKQLVQAKLPSERALVKRRSKQKKKEILHDHPIRSYEKAKILLDNAIKNFLLKETNNKNFKNIISIYSLDKLKNQSYFINKNITQSKLLFNFSILKSSQQNKNLSESKINSTPFVSSVLRLSKAKVLIHSATSTNYQSSTFACAKAMHRGAKQENQKFRKNKTKESNFLKIQNNNKLKENHIIIKKITEKLKFDLDKLLFSKRFKKNFILNTQQNYSLLASSSRSASEIRRTQTKFGSNLHKHSFCVLSFAERRNEEASKRSKNNLKFLFLLNSNLKNTNNILKKFKKMKGRIPSIKENNIKNYIYELSVLNYWKKSLNLLNLNNNKLSYSSKFFKNDRFFGTSVLHIFGSNEAQTKAKAMYHMSAQPKKQVNSKKLQQNIKTKEKINEAFLYKKNKVHLKKQTHNERNSQEFFNKFAKIEKLLRRNSKDSSFFAFHHIFGKAFAASIEDITERSTASPKQALPRTEATSNLNPIKLKNSIITSDLFYNFNILSNKFLYNKKQNLLYNYHLYSYNINSKENYINKNFYALPHFAKTRKSKKNKKVLGKFMLKSISNIQKSQSKISRFAEEENQRWRINFADAQSRNEEEQSKILKNKEKNTINFILHLKHISFNINNFFSKLFSKLYSLIDNFYKIFSNDLTKKTSFLETNFNNINFLKNHTHSARKQSLLVKTRKKLIKKKNKLFGSALPKCKRFFAASAKPSLLSSAKDRMRRSKNLHVNNIYLLHGQKKEKIFRSLLSYKFSYENVNPQLFGSSLCERLRKPKRKCSFAEQRSADPCVNKVYKQLAQAKLLLREHARSEQKKKEHKVKKKLKKRMRNLLSINSNNNKIQYKYFHALRFVNHRYRGAKKSKHNFCERTEAKEQSKRVKALLKRVKQEKGRVEKKEKNYKNNISLNRILRRIGFVFLTELKIKKKNINVSSYNMNYNKKESLKQRFEKEKSLQKRRRRKKLKLETRRRKKRKRFYPRPVWLRYSLYKKFLNCRHSYKNFYYRKKVKASSYKFFNELLHFATARKQKKNEKIINISNFFFKNQKLKNKIYRNNKQKWGNFIQDTPLFEKISLKKINFFPHFPVFQNKEYYKVSSRILAEFQPLCWKSYWLRSNLTPYMNRIQKNFSFMKQVEKTNNISNINTFLYKIFGFFSYDFYSFKFTMLPFYTDFKNSFDNQHAFYLSNLLFQENTNKIAEYNRIEFERFSEILKNVKFNMNLEGQLKPKSYKFIAWKYLLSSRGARELKTFNKKNFWYRLSYNFKPNLSSVSPFAILSNTFSKNSASIKPYGSSGTLRALWAFNKTNIFTFKEKNQIRNLWEQTKLREQLKSNQTKKFLINLIKVKENLYKKDIFSHSLSSNLKNLKSTFASTKAMLPLRQSMIDEAEHVNFSTIKKLQTAQRKLVLMSLFQQKSLAFGIKECSGSKILKQKYSNNFMNQRFTSLLRVSERAKDQNKKSNISYNYYIHLLKSKISNLKLNTKKNLTLASFMKQTQRSKELKTKNFVFSYTLKNKKDSPFINIAKPRLLKPSSYFWWSSKNFQIPLNLNLQTSSLHHSASETSKNMFNDSYTSLISFSESYNQLAPPKEHASVRGQKKETPKISITQHTKTNKLIVYNILIFSILFHLSILFSFIRIPELRGLLKFQILLFYKISNSYFIILYSIYDLLKKYKTETFKTYNSLYEKTYKLLSYINILDLQLQSTNSLPPFGKSDYSAFHFEKETKKIIFSELKNQNIQKTKKTEKTNFYNLKYSNILDKINKNNKLFDSRAQLRQSTDSRINKVYSLLRFAPQVNEQKQKKQFSSYYFLYKISFYIKNKKYFYFPTLNSIHFYDKPSKIDESALKYPKIYNKDLKSYNETKKKDLSFINFSKSFTTYVTSQTPFIYSFSYNILEYFYTKKILNKILYFKSQIPNESQTKSKKNLYQNSDLKILLYDIKTNNITELYKRFMSFKNIQTYFALFILYLSYGFVRLSIGIFESSYQLLLKIIDLFESFLLIIYKFLEKPAELMIEWIAQIFLIEWSSDPSSFIPETFDMYFWYSFQKFFRNTRILGFVEFQNSTNIYNIMNSFELSGFNGKQIQFHNYNYDILSIEKTLGTSMFSFSISNILGFFIQRRLWNFFHLFIDSMLKPDIDLIVRQQKGKIFWDIWADILIRAAEQYNINIPSLTSLKEEQEKLIERLIQDPAFINFSVLNSFDNNSLLHVSSAFVPSLRKRAKVQTKFKSNLRKHSFCASKSRNVLKNFYKTKSWSSNQYVTFNLKDTDLFLDISPPKSLLYVHFINSYEPIQYTLGSIMCEIYSGLFSNKVSKNLLIVNSHVSDLPLRSAISSNFLHSNKSSFDFQSGGSYGSLIIQALAGESEMKMMIDNANRYASIHRGVAVGMKLLRDVFESIVLQTPCFFLMEDLHVIGERRPMLISDDENSYEKEFSIFGFEQDEESEKNQMIYQSSRHSINDFKRPYKGDFSMLIPTNLYNKDLYSFKTFLNNTKPTRQKKYPISLPSLHNTIENKMFDQSHDKNKSLNVSQSFNISRLQIASENFFAPPATSPFTILMMKEQRKLKPKKVVKQISWNSFVAENIIASKNDSIRVKVAILADMTLRNFSYNKDMITDLLVIIDGVRSNRGFVVFATTHVPSILDPALRRPGRFDETISLPLLPNLMNRWSLFQMHFNQEILQKKVSKETFDRFEYGILTENFNFAQISNIISKTKLTCNVNYNHVKSPIIHPSQAFQSFFVVPGEQMQTIAKKQEKDFKIIPSNYSNFCLAPLKKTRKNFRKIYSQISFGYFQIGNLLISSDFLKDQTYFSLYNKSLLLEQSSPFVYHTLYSSLNTFKMFIMKLLGGKIAEFLVSKNQRNLYDSLNKTKATWSSIAFTQAKEEQLASSAESTPDAKLPPTEERTQSEQKKEAQKLNFSIMDHMIRYKSWHFATSLIFSILQKRFLYNKNLIITKMLSFDNPNQSSLREPPSPPASSLLMPSKKYENFKRIERDFQQKSGFSIYEKMQMHQKQRFLKRLYNKPVLESFKSQLFENRLTSFESSFKEFSYNKDSNLLKLSSSHSYYKNKLNIRHRFSLINQWWNGQLAEHNVEVTYLSDIDWRTMYIQSYSDNYKNKKENNKPSYEKLGLKQSKSILSYSKTSNKTDSMLDFPDADQHYNPRVRRWFLNANSWNYWLNFENTFYYEIYHHMIYDAFNKTSLYFNQNRELLDFFVYTYNIKGSLKEIDLIFILSRFYRK
uniref:Cell division protein n=1 Tax=Pseudopediastrum boryanum TaxID=55410 RepID=A0A2U8GJ54_PSEBY|nr:cell division protein [Pseudopediastrum boryanum]